MKQKKRKDTWMEKAEREKVKPGSISNNKTKLWRAIGNFNHIAQSRFELSKWIFDIFLNLF